jgi:hypothetical protein
MAIFQPNFAPTARETRRFAGLWLPVFLLILAGVLAARAGGAGAGTFALVAAAAAISAAGIASRKAARAIYLGWMCGVYPVGWTVSHAVLAATFYGAVTPVALVQRLLRRDALRLRRDPQAGSHWVRCENPDDLRCYLRQF